MVTNLFITSREYNNILKMCGVSYMGACTQSAKMRYSFDNGTMTYCLYLAPWDLSGYNICPMGIHCKDNCLNASGQNKADMLARGKMSNINVSRIKKTRFFFEHKEEFMKAIIFEIAKYQRIAESKGMEFSVRLNGTSDLSPLTFVIYGMNILEIFPNIQFYDYTKVPNRFELLTRYSNYDITFSFDGYNWDICEQFLNLGGKVAVVFENPKELPISFKGYPIWDANVYDMRYKDPMSHIMGLHYHRTANDYVNRKYVRPTSPFIVKEDDVNCVW